MATVEQFEDLIAWQRSHELARRLYTLTNTGEFSKAFGFRDQTRRAAVSFTLPKMNSEKQCNWQQKRQKSLVAYDAQLIQATHNSALSPQHWRTQ